MTPIKSPTGLGSVIKKALGGRIGQPRAFSSWAAIIGLSFLAALPVPASAQVKLESVIPAVAEAGLTTIRLMGSGFPTGVTINPANIQVQLTPQDGGSATFVAASQYQAVLGTLGQVAFLAPASLAPTAPAVFAASISDRTDGLSRVNSVSFAIDPVASISAASPSSAQDSQSISVTITGSYSHFLGGLSQVSAGAGITVGAPTVAGPTSLAAQFVVAAGAALGARTITVTTGGEVASLVGGFTVQGPTVAVPSVTGDTQAAAATSLTAVGLKVGTTTTQMSGTVPSGEVISESPVAGTSVSAGSPVNLVVSFGPSKEYIYLTADDRRYSVKESRPFRPTALATDRA